MPAFERRWRPRHGTGQHDNGSGRHRAVCGRLDRKAINISLLVVLGVRRDGQKVLLAVRNMGGESEAAWRATLDGLIGRGLRTPDFLITDGGAGLERALAALRPGRAGAALHGPYHPYAIAWF